MPINTEFIHLHPIGMSPCSMDRNALGQAKMEWLCEGCGAPKPFIGVVDVQIQEGSPEDAPLTFVSGCGVILAKRDFINALDGAGVQSDLFLGEVRNPFGQKINDWVTVRARKRLIIRGSKNISHRCCELCGRHVYFAMGQRYLFSAPTGASIYETDLYGLLVLPSVLDGASLEVWPSLGVESLKVLAQPKDGIGCLES